MIDSKPVPSVLSTEPFTGSAKIHVEGTRPGVRVPMREIRLSPTRTAAGLVVENPPVTVYDTSGPYTDPDARIDLAHGLPPLRREWIVCRGDVEELPAVSSEYGRRRAADPALAPSASPRRAGRSAPGRVGTSPRCTTPGRASSPPRWSSSPSARTSDAS